VNDCHPYALALYDFFSRRLNLSSRWKELLLLLSDLLKAQEDGHACLKLSLKQRALLERPALTRLYLPPGEAPLVLEEDRLYFQRLWRYEETLACGIRELLRGVRQLDEEKLKLLAEAGELDPSQREAVRRAAQRNFAILSGGPGTGKTTTALKLIAGLAWQEPNRRIALAAPTGKAAQRLKESVVRGLPQLPLPEAVKAALPTQAFTLHRLLGVREEDLRARYDAQNPLPYEIVVVDEASMVDLALSAKLVQALPPQGSLYLLGDRDQLASVEAGSVLADLCDGAPSHTFRLTQTHRFPAHLRALAEAVKAGNTAEFTKLLGPDYLPVREDSLWQALEAGFSPYFRAVKARAGPQELLAQLARFKALCAHRRGPLGSEWLNRELSLRFRRKGWIAARGDYYPGRPILITANAPELELFNGDVGVVWEDKVWFEDGRCFAPARLPAHETCLAMSVHKAQGSEFEKVLLVLPTKPSEVLSRELVYTAITRAKSCVQCFGPQTVLNYALSRCVQRQSGLRYKLI
jgi:exodeoxyribonuclease V alpha subunit